MINFFRKKLANEKPSENHTSNFLIICIEKRGMIDTLISAIDTEIKLKF